LINQEKYIKSGVQYLKFNHTSTLLAVVNSGGKYIVIVDVESKKVKVQLYRGMKQASIKSIAFSFDDQYVALASDKLSVHIFHIGPNLKCKFLKIDLY
jgi:hypothetical protein